jgi:glycine/D-amino acid oxidase-like deaminating enzyme
VARPAADVVICGAGIAGVATAYFLSVVHPVGDVVLVFQEKIAIRDPLGVVPRDAPFTILLDGQRLEWSAEERREWETDPQRRWLLDPLPGGVHIRPEGGRDSEWIKLGWAFNRRPEAPTWERSGAPEFPEVVVRGACRMIPGLRPYVGRLPTPVVHYGGYYTKTPDGLPLVGPLGIDGAHVVGALAGYGTMAACAAGELAAAGVVGAARADYAEALMPGRLGDARYLAALPREADRGEL